MATPTLAELYTQLTPEQIEASALKVAEQVGLPVTAWEEGSAGRELIVIFCTLMSSYLSGSSSTAAAAGLLDYASGDWLHLTGQQVFETEFIDATFGTSQILLTNQSLTPYPIAVDDLRFGVPGSQATYVNTESGVLAAWSGSGDFPTLALAIIAENPGSGSSTAAGTITEMVTPLAGVSCTNTLPCVGTDAETDAAYRLRCREAASRLSPNGPVDAYNYFAKSTVRGDGTNCGVTRTKAYQPLTQPGVVILYVASDAGAVAPSDVALVQANLVANCVPTGFTCSTQSAEVFTQYVAATVYLAPGSSSTSGDIAALVLAALETYFESLPIGGVVLSPGEPGYVFLDMLIATIVGASDQIVQAVITNFSSDVQLATYQVAVLTSTAGSFSVVAT